MQPDQYTLTLGAWFQTLIEHPYNPILKVKEGSQCLTDVLLPSTFLPRFPGDPLAEGFSTVDGVLGHFSCITARHDVALLPDAEQLVVFTFWDYSRDRAQGYRAVSRTAGCIAELLRRGNRSARQFTSLELILLIDDRDSDVRTRLHFKQLIRQVIERRVSEYAGARDVWFNVWFLPTLDRLELRLMPSSLAYSKAPVLKSPLPE